MRQHSPPRVGHVPRDSASQFCAPVGSLPTGATAFLEVQQANHHSRKNARQQADENVPEEAFHGDTLLSGEAAPHPYPTKSHLHPQSISPVSDDAGDFLCLFVFRTNITLFFSLQPRLF